MAYKKRGTGAYASCGRRDVRGRNGRADRRRDRRPRQFDLVQHRPARRRQFDHRRRPDQHPGRTVIHTLYDGAPHPSQTHIGNDVSIGHNATIHGAIIEDNCLIGMGATVLDNAVVASGCIVSRRRAGVVGRETRTQFGLCRRPGPQGQGDYARTTRRDHPAHRPRLPYVRLVVRGGQIAVR